MVKQIPLHSGPVLMQNYVKIVLVSNMHVINNACDMQLKYIIL